MILVVTTPTPMPDVLYHYTDTAGLLGILSNPVSFPGTDKGVFATETGATFGTLWATDARYLNDAQELTYGAEILAVRLEAAARASTTPTVIDRLQELAGDVRTGRFELTRIGSGGNKSRPHVTCFCKSGNLLSQWRGYGDGGGGYAIGFSKSAFDDFILIDGHRLQTEPHFAVTPVLSPSEVYYGTAEAASFLDRAARSVAGALEADASGTESFTWPDTFRGICTQWLAQVKHDAFREEAEWRLIVDRVGIDHTEFRAGRIGLVPYQKLHFPIASSGVSSISEIVVGPGGERELRKESLVRLLAKIGSSGTKVSLSNAPFRG